MLVLEFLRQSRVSADRLILVVLSQYRRMLLTFLFRRVRRYPSKLRKVYISFLQIWNEIGWYCHIMEVATTEKLKFTEVSGRAKCDMLQILYFIQVYSRFVLPVCCLKRTKCFLPHGYSYSGVLEDFRYSQNLVFSAVIIFSKTEKWKRPWWWSVIQYRLGFGEN